MIFKPQIARKPKLTKDTPCIHYEYVQQNEVQEQLLKQIEEVLKPYKNRDDIDIYIGKGTEHPVSEPDCLSIRLQIMIKPRKEIVVEEGEWKGWKLL